MNKHTPGPWYVEGAGVHALVRGADSTIVAVRHRLGAMTHEANARLICAAPDMMDALKKLNAWWLDDFPNEPDGEYPNRLCTLSDDTKNIWREIQSAIAKAEGRS